MTQGSIECPLARAARKQAAMDDMIVAGQVEMRNDDGPAAFVAHVLYLIDEQFQQHVGLNGAIEEILKYPEIDGLVHAFGEAFGVQRCDIEGRVRLHAQPRRNQAATRPVRVMAMPMGADRLPCSCSEPRKCEISL